MNDYEMNKLVAGNKTVFFGTRKSDNAKIYLTSPSWDCSWYWSFGYLGNKNEHYHLESYANGRNINMYDALLSDYELNPLIEKDLWKFCELAKTAYTLKNTAEMLGRGGSHYTNNPCKDIIINKEEVIRINEVVLPAIFNEISQIFVDKAN